MSAIELKHPH